eukprot:g907.t1
MTSPSIKGSGIYYFPPPSLSSSTNPNTDRGYLARFYLDDGKVIPTRLIDYQRNAFRYRQARLHEHFYPQHNTSASSGNGYHNYHGGGSGENNVDASRSMSFKDLRRNIEKWKSFTALSNNNPGNLGSSSNNANLHNQVGSTILIPPFPPLTSADLLQGLTFTTLHIYRRTTAGQVILNLMKTLYKKRTKMAYRTSVSQQKHRTTSPIPTGSPEAVSPALSTKGSQSKKTSEEKNGGTLQKGNQNEMQGTPKGSSSASSRIQNTNSSQNKLINSTITVEKPAFPLADDHTLLLVCTSPFHSWTVRPLHLGERIIDILQNLSTEHMQFLYTEPSLNPRKQSSLGGLTTKTKRGSTRKSMMRIGGNGPGNYGNSSGSLTNSGRTTTGMDPSMPQALHESFVAFIICPKANISRLVSTNFQSLSPKVQFRNPVEEFCNLRLFTSNTTGLDNKNQSDYVVNPNLISPESNASPESNLTNPSLRPKANPNQDKNTNVTQFVNTPHSSSSFDNDTEDEEIDCDERTVASTTSFDQVDMNVSNLNGEIDLDNVDNNLEEEDGGDELESDEFFMEDGTFFEAQEKSMAPHFVIGPGDRYGMLEMQCSDINAVADGNDVKMSPDTSNSTVSKDTQGKKITNLASWELRYCVLKGGHLYLARGKYDLEDLIDVTHVGLADCDIRLVDIPGIKTTPAKSGLSGALLRRRRAKDPQLAPAFEITTRAGQYSKMLYRLRGGTQEVVNAWIVSLKHRADLAFENQLFHLQETMLLHSEQRASNRDQRIYEELASSLKGLLQNKVSHAF